MVKKFSFKFTGEDHRRFRAALSPGFSSAVVRSFLPIFSDVAQRVTILVNSEEQTLDLGFFRSLKNGISFALQGLQPWSMFVICWTTRRWILSAKVFNFLIFFSEAVRLKTYSIAALGLPLNTVADPKHPLAQSHLNVL